MEILEITPHMAILVPITVGLVQVVKNIVVKIDKIKDFADVIAVVSSIVIGLGLAYANPIADTNTLLQGLSVGLMASGLFSATKTVADRI